ncbi:MAG TPA: PP2C family serine/threonine-protein phosphatase [Armatimonadota bacterium]
MDSSLWRTAFASVIGVSHAESATPCQDASRCILKSAAGDAEILILVISDGAGSAIQSHHGSALACEAFVTAITSLHELEGDLHNLNREWLTGWVEEWRHTVSESALANGYQLRDYACTLLAAVVSTKEAFFFQIGDGAIVVRDTDETDQYAYVFWPVQHEYANVTDFLSDKNAAQKILFDTYQGYIDELALFSDGLQRVALLMNQQKVHSPFFRRLFPPLRVLSPDSTVNASFSLGSFLSSPRINERTDDDKSLILATRYTAGTIEVAAKE